MDNKNIIMIAIVVLVIALVCVGAYSLTQNNDSNTTQVNNTTSTSAINGSADNSSVKTAVADNDHSGNLSSKNNNSTFKVYNPQSDSYVSVIGEKYDDEVDRWYTYDADGVRYYNTRIN